jgi:hypothetical protein
VINKKWHILLPKTFKEYHKDFAYLSIFYDRDYNRFNARINERGLNSLVRLLILRGKLTNDVQEELLPYIISGDEYV